MPVLGFDEFWFFAFKEKAQSLGRMDTLLSKTETNDH
jgi:hypothetical protein